MAWRDEASLSTMVLVHAAGCGAIQALEDCIDEIAISDAIAGADAAARIIVRPVMRARVAAAIDDWFLHQMQALQRVDPQLEALARRFGDTGERPPLPQDDIAVTKESKTPSWISGSVDAIGLRIDRITAKVTSRELFQSVRKRAEDMSALVAHEVGERSGAHDKLREAAQAELSRFWLGPASKDATPQPYLTSLLDLVDRITRQAMERIA